jgi:nucleotide-binding universal stress UspA family protein
VRIGIDAAAHILWAARDGHADLIVMATHGRTGVRRAVFGSVTGAVLRDGTTPVLVVHPRVETGAAAVPEPIDDRMTMHF